MGESIPDVVLTVQIFVWNSAAGEMAHSSPRFSQGATFQMFEMATDASVLLIGKVRMKPRPGNFMSKVKILNGGTDGMMCSN